MAWTTSNPVSIGGATKKSDYDKLWDNAFLLAGVSFTGSTAGKTITVTQDTSLDEAVAMSSKLTLALGAANLKAFMNAAGTAPEWADGTKIGTFAFNIANVPYDLAVGNVGFKPSKVFIFGGILNTTNISFGLDNGTNHYTMYLNYSGGTWGYDPTMVLLLNISATELVQGYILTLGADGFTIRLTKAASPAGIPSFYYIAFR